MRERIDGVLFDLLMGVMNSLETWTAAAGDPALGLAWRDAVTERMKDEPTYRSYERLVDEAAAQLGLSASAATRLLDAWHAMSPWPDGDAIRGLDFPYAFVTNSSRSLADVAARRSGLSPRFTLSAEEAGCYKPDRRIYLAACRRLAFAPERTAFVAGSPYDADGAHAAGLRAFLIRRRSDQPAPRPAVVTLDSLADVAAALG